MVWSGSKPTETCHQSHRCTVADVKNLHGIKGGLNKYLEETSLDGYYTGINRNQEIPKLKIP